MLGCELVRQWRADHACEAAHHAPAMIRTADTGQGDGSWPKILCPLPAVVDSLPVPSWWSLPSDTFIRTRAADRGAFKVDAESSTPGVDEFGRRS